MLYLALVRWTVFLVTAPIRLVAGEDVHVAAYSGIMKIISGVLMLTLGCVLVYGLASAAGIAGNGRTPNPDKAVVAAPVAASEWSTSDSVQETYPTLSTHPTPSPDPTPTPTPAAEVPLDDTFTPIEDGDDAEFVEDASRTRSVAVTVTKVIDGDTIVVKMPSGKRETVQVLGIDTPERGQREYKGAIADLRSALKWGKEWIEADTIQPNRDRSGRLLRHLWVGVDRTPGTGSLYSSYALHWRNETERVLIKHKYRAYLRDVDENRAINEPIPDWP